MSVNEATTANATAAADYSFSGGIRPDNDLKPETDDEEEEERARRAFIDALK